MVSDLVSAVVTLSSRDSVDSRDSTVSPATFSDIVEVTPAVATESLLLETAAAVSTGELTVLTFPAAFSVTPDVEAESAGSAKIPLSDTVGKSSITISVAGDEVEQSSVKWPPRQ